MRHIAQPRPAAPARPAAERLVTLQYLRGIAAMMVVVHHVLHEREGFFSPFAGADLGQAGVLVFFVLSGVVMMHAGRDEAPGVFVRRRIIRVVPLYWLATLAYYLLVLRRDIAAGDPLATVPELVQSLLFLPHAHHDVPGRIWPVLVPGWTLNFEMFFYALFAAGLLSGHVRLTAPVALVALVIAGWALPLTSAPALVWTSPLLLLFLAGMGLALMWERGLCSRLATLLPPATLALLAASFGFLPEPATAPAMGLAAVGVVGGALGLEASGPPVRSRLLSVLGEASYAIYLIHTLALIGLLRALALLPLDGWAQFWVTVPLAVVGSTLAGIGVHLWVERPLTTALVERFVPVPGPRPVAA